MLQRTKFPTEVRKLGFNTSYPGCWEDGGDMGMAELAFIAVSNCIEMLDINISPDPLFLEVGSGNGILLNHFRKQNLDIVGIDARPRPIRPNSCFIASRVEQMPFQDNVFDVILSVQAFDLVVYEQDHGFMLDEIHRVLKPGGIYIGFVEIIESIKEDLPLIMCGTFKGHQVVHRKEV